MATSRAAPIRLGLAVALVLVVVLLMLSAIGASPATAHRSACHRAHSCPSDHATYRWRGLLCVKPTAYERNSSFRKRVVYARRTYYCKR